MDKVLLPKQVADAIHYFQTKGKERTLFNVPTIASSSTKNKNSKVIHDFIQSSDENFKKYFNALVNGYQVDLSKEETLKNLYLKYSELEYSHRTLAIRETLKILGIQIEGVNK